MSHVDDGILHAYLDGALELLSDAGELPDGTTAADVVAHLGSCADCRARLETERAVRESAGLVMGDLSRPGIVPPGLPALTAPRPSGKRWMPLGWAASVVLAVGAGWIGSEVWRDDLPFASQETRPYQQSTMPGSAGADGASANAMDSSPAGESSAAAASSPAVESLHSGASSSPGARAVASSPAEEGPDAAVSADAAGPLQPTSSSYARNSLDAQKAAGAQSGIIRSGESEPRPAAPTAGVAAAAPSAAGDTRAGYAPPAAQRERVRPAGAPALAQVEALPPPSSDRPVIGRAERITGRSEVPLGRSVVSDEQENRFATMSEARISPADAQNVLAPRMQEMAAFRTVLAREQEGRIRFAEVSPADLASLGGQIFVVADASAPSIEAAREIGQTVVRVRQTTASGEQVELLTWRLHTVALEGLVVTGRPSEVRSLAQSGDERRAQERRARSEAADAPPQQDTAQAITVQVMQASVRTLDDDRRELVLGTADGSVWIAVRARVGEEELRALARRVTLR